MGDLLNINCDINESDTTSTNFLKLLMNIYLSQHIKEPTRENNVLLHLVISSEFGMVENMEELEHLGEQ
jgi:hypothetical protein